MKISGHLKPKPIISAQASTNWFNRKSQKSDTTSGNGPVFRILCFVGAQVEQVGEHPGAAATFVFEMEAYPEAKSLRGNKLKALYRKFKSWRQVAKAVGSSESFVRQNSGRKE